MRILVFGKNGQLARCLDEAGPAFGHDVICQGRLDCDVTKREQVAKTIQAVGADLIVNAAAYTAVEGAQDDVEGAFLLNETAVRHIAEEANVPVVQLSTDYVFNGESDLPYEVEDTIDPLGVYGQSKWAGEEALRTTNARHIILRTAWVFSPYGNNFVKTMRRLMGDRDEISVVDDQRGCPTSAQDLAKAILKIAARIVEDGFQGFGTYHLVSETQVTWCEFAREIQRQSMLDCVVHAIASSEFPSKVKRPAFSVLSVKKFRETFGFGLPDWQNSLSKCLRQLDQTGE